MTDVRTLPAVPSLVVGSVSHTRFRPTPYRLAHRHYQWLVDVDRPPRLPVGLGFLGTVRAADHLDGGAHGGIRGDVAHLLQQHGRVLEPTDRVLMLAHPRAFGHVFNPLSVYLCVDAEDDVRAVVLEVHNTYGGQHAYLLEPDVLASSGEVDKRLYVSPFNDESGSYRVRLRFDTEKVLVSVALDRDDTRVLNASAFGTPVPLTTGRLLRYAARTPLMTYRVSALIRWHGVKLWLKRLPVQPRSGSRANPGRLRAAVAARVLSVAARRVPVDIVLPDGSTFGRRNHKARQAGRPSIELVRPEAMYRRVATNPKLGVGEGYMAGDWRAGPDTDLADALLPFAERLAAVLPAWMVRMRGLVDSAHPQARRNTRDGSRRNIAAHYDLGNDLFSAFLDQTLTYSSALFSDDRPWPEQSLEEAQRRKIERVLDLAHVTPGCRLLEIGTGWGAFAVAAAQRGAHVTTLTLSREQAELARRRIEAAGLADRVDVQLRDYRDAEGSFDAIVSIEMIEAVGEAYWPTYFRAIDERLAPGGRAVLQAIVMSHERFLATRHSHGWVQEHIFPGGLIPSLEAIDETTRSATRLEVSQVELFGRHYAETLHRWRSSFLARWPELPHDRYDETFRRMWEFYLAYCEAGFASGYLDVAHLTLTRPTA